MKYLFNVTEHSYGHLEIEAENEEEARGKADEMYQMGNTYWAGGDYEISLEGCEESE